jgi:1-deoxy-D-xylulose-5-phosphate reductoisomerase
VGAVGLNPILAALDAGNRLALANKEPLEMAGRLIIERARARAVDVLPVDSEHNAIFQCLHGHRTDDVRCIHLTASGGPFYGRPRASLAGVSPEEAANHPRWDMGKKISVDSATLMNKGLEVIEAHWLFGVGYERIRVVVHPQSVVHSMVEFSDGSVKAHLGATDMRVPIQYALSYPDRWGPPVEPVDFTTLGALGFEPPDTAGFPCLALAYEAGTAGGTMPAVLNAANDGAVAAFLAGRARFDAIPAVVERVLHAHSPGRADTIEAVEAADSWARAQAEALLA